jgi:hypothetical protein
MGGPDAVVFLARAPGRARIEVLRGGPSPGVRQPVLMDLIIEP